MAGRKHLCLFALFTIFALVVADDETTSKESAEPIPSFKQGIRFDNFDLSFSKALYSSTAGNVAVSPVSIKIMLAMIYEASAGESARQIQQTLALGQKSETRRKFRAILNSLTSGEEGKCELKLSSRLFVSPEAFYSAGYRRVLYTHFNAEITQVNFSHPLEAAGIINSWACNSTDDKVKELISKDDPELPTLKMVLANTLFFRGAWEVPFNPAMTAKSDFHLSDGTIVQVDMMKTKGQFFYAEDQTCGYKLLRMPYQGGQYSLYLLLPNEKDGLGRLVEQLTPESIREAIVVMKKQDVLLNMPKFAVKYRADVKSVLTKLGISRIFSRSEAELPRLSKDNSVFVSKLIHEAGLEVDETGSTAYAATQAQLTTKMFTDQIFFNVDHPFVLFIKDDTAETVVFAAKVHTPLAVQAAGGGGGGAEPQARALLSPEPTPLTNKTITLYPPNFFPSTLNESKVFLEKLNHTAEAAAGAAGGGRDSVVMRIPPRDAKKTPEN